MGLPTDMELGGIWTCPDHLCERQHALPSVAQDRPMAHTCTCGTVTSWATKDGKMTCTNANRGKDGVKRQDGR